MSIRLGVGFLHDVAPLRRLRAEEGSGIISVNGAAAHRAQPGDLVIICAYGAVDEAEAAKFKPTLVYVDRDNALTHTNDSIPAQAAA